MAGDWEKLATEMKGRKNHFGLGDIADVDVTSNPKLECMVSNRSALVFFARSALYFRDPPRKTPKSVRSAFRSVTDYNHFSSRRKRRSGQRLS